MLKKTNLIVLLLTGLNITAFGQQIGTWQAHTAMATINFIEEDRDGVIWSATEGGLFAAEDDRIIRQFTPTEGMYRVAPTAMAYDSEYHRLWLGYLDGTFEYLDIEEQRFRTFRDIARADRYSPRGINAIKTRGDQIFIATDFGVVVFNSGSLSVGDTYSNLGDFPSGARVQDIGFRGDTLFCATPIGIAAGDLAGSDLVVPSSWKNYTTEDGLGNVNIRHLGIYSGGVFAASTDSLFRYSNSQWLYDDAFDSLAVNQLKASDNGNMLLAAADDAVFKLDTDGSVTSFQAEGGPNNSVHFAEQSNRLYVGTTSSGLVIAPETGGSFQVLPAGPYLNFFKGLHYDNGVIISGSSSSPGRSQLAFSSTGYYIFEDENWRSYNLDNESLLSQRRFNSVFTSTSTNDHYFFGSWGKGVAMHHKDTDEIHIFNRQNSPLKGYLTTSNDFIVVPGLAADRSNNLWVVSWQHDLRDPLYRYNPSSNEWTEFPRSGVLRSTDHYYNLKVDSYDQKWIGLTSNRSDGQGLLVLRTDGDENDMAVRLSEANNHLPNNKINAIIQDQRGEVWIGTDYGVARFPFPDRVIDGNEQDRRASLLINADTTAPSPFLLSTIKVTAIAVNAANEKWIGTDGGGLWLIGERGGRHEVKKHFTTQNSPLISDNIISLAVNDENGAVFIATDEGLITYNDITRGGEPEMDRLFIYPNPFSYQKDEERIIIDGLSDQTTVRIVAVDGRLINRLEVRGGRAEWNVRDHTGSRVATGVYLVIAVDDDNGNRGSGKVVIVR